MRKPQTVRVYYMGSIRLATLLAHFQPVDEKAYFYLQTILGPYLPMDSAAAADRYVMGLLAGRPTEFPQPLPPYENNGIAILFQAVPQLVTEPLPETPDFPLPATNLGII